MGLYLNLKTKTDRNYSVGENTVSDMARQGKLEQDIAVQAWQDKRYVQNVFY